MTTAILMALLFGLMVGFIGGMFFMLTNAGRFYDQVWFQFEEKDKARVVDYFKSLERDICSLLEFEKEGVNQCYVFIRVYKMKTFNHHEDTVQAYQDRVRKSLKKYGVNVIESGLG